MFTESIISRAGEETECLAGLIESVCQPFLAASQNPDGGWGYHPGSESSVEATAWALMAAVAQRSPQSGTAVCCSGAVPSAEPPVRTPALQELPQGQTTGPALQTPDLARGFDWLKQAQLPDGSWPAFKSLREGCWVTSLACLALSARDESADQLAKGLKWLVGSRPAESTLWRRLQRCLSRKSSVARQNHSLHGWSWTPGTASWVEPTAYTLILFASVPEKLYPSGTAHRIRLAESMLCDRMCPGGGWNAGNPEVYSVAGMPRVGPTAWALIALRRDGARPEHRESVRWLEDHYSEIRGPASLALTHLALASCGRRVPPVETALRRWYEENKFFRSVPVFAWVALASGGELPWATQDETHAPGNER